MRPQTVPLFDRTWPAILVLCLLAIVSYSNSLNGPFIFDDVEAIPGNASIRDLAKIGQVLSPPFQTSVAGRPILNFSFAVNHAIGGTAVRGYHVANLLIHLAAGLLLYDVVRRTLRLPRVAPVLQGAAGPIALSVAALWIVHPLHTSAVTYVIQRAESLMGFLYLLAFDCFLRGAERDRPAARAWFAGAVVACALGMGTKEAMATAPLVILAFDRIFLAESWRSVVRRRGVVHALLAATWIILALLVPGTGGRSGTVGFHLATSPAEYAGTQFGVILHYVRLSFVPYPLALDYGWPVARGLGVVLPAIPVLGLVALTAWALAKRPRIGFLGLAFFAILAPTSSVLPIQDCAAFEHRMYLPLASLLAAVAVGVYRLLGAGAGRAGPRNGTAVAVLAGVIVAVFAAATYARNRDYESEMRIWQDTVRKRPMNARAWDMLGVAHANEGDFAGAVEYHSKAIELRADNSIAYYNRGTSYLRSGMYRQAVDDLSQAIRLRREGDTFNNRALAHAQLGEFDAAWADVDTCRQLGYEPHPGFLRILEKASGRVDAAAPERGATR